MDKLILTIWLITLLHPALCSRLKPPPPPDNSRVVCYYVDLPKLLPQNAQFGPEDIPRNTCTHLVLGPAGVDSLTLRDPTPDQVSTYKMFTDARKADPKAKVTLAVKAVSQEERTFPLVKNDDGKNRKRGRVLARAVLQYVTKYGFDGVDMLWEYPDDIPTSQLLMEALKAEFDKSTRRDLLLTSSIECRAESLFTSQTFNLTRMSLLVDFFNIRPYTTKRREVEVRSARCGRYLHSLGVPVEKTVLGVATFGFTEDRTNNKGNEQTALTTVPKMSPMTYGDVCKKKKKKSVGDQVKTSLKQALKLRMLNIGGGPERNLPNLMKTRKLACTAKTGGWGGIMMWTLAGDDFRGTSCGQGRYPLLTAVKDVFDNPGNHCRVDNSSHSTPNMSQAILGCDGRFGVLSTNRSTYFRSVFGRWIQMSCHPSVFSLESCQCYRPANGTAKRKTGCGGRYAVQEGDSSTYYRRVMDRWVELSCFPGSFHLTTCRCDNDTSRVASLDVRTGQFVKLPLIRSEARTQKTSGWMTVLMAAHTLSSVALALLAG